MYLKLNLKTERGCNGQFTFRVSKTLTVFCKFQFELLIIIKYSFLDIMISLLIRWLSVMINFLWPFALIVYIWFNFRFVRGNLIFHEIVNLLFL